MAWRSAAMQWRLSTVPRGQGHEDALLEVLPDDADLRNASLDQGGLVEREPRCGPRALARREDPRALGEGVV